MADEAGNVGDGTIQCKGKWLMRNVMAVLTGIFLSSCAGDASIGASRFVSVCEQPQSSLGRTLAKFIDNDYPHEHGTYFILTELLNLAEIDTSSTEISCPTSNNRFCNQIVNCQQNDPFGRSEITYTLTYRLVGDKILLRELRTINSYGVRGLIFGERENR